MLTFCFKEMKVWVTQICTKVIQCSHGPVLASDLLCLMKYDEKVLGWMVRHQEFSEFDDHLVLPRSAYSNKVVFQAESGVLQLLLYIHLNNISSRKPSLCMIYSI